jgi:hypothetical protein
VTTTTSNGNLLWLEEVAIMVIELIDGEDDRIGLTVKKWLNTTCLETSKLFFYRISRANALRPSVY